MEGYSGAASYDDFLIFTEAVRNLEGSVAEFRLGRYGAGGLPQGSFHGQKCGPPTRKIHHQVYHRRF